MMMFRLKQFGFGSYTARFLWKLFGRWSTFVPETETVNGFDGNRLPIVGVIRYFDYSTDQEDADDPYFEWFVLEPEWWFWFRIDIIQPFKLKIRRLLIRLKLRHESDMGVGFLVPPEIARELQRNIPFKMTIKVDTQRLWDGENG